MSKYYFSNLVDTCWTLKGIKMLMRLYDVDEIEVEEARLDTSASGKYFYCTFYNEIGNVGENCGKICSEYAPRNGKNGRCRYSAHCYEPTGKKRTIKI